MTLGKSAGRSARNPSRPDAHHRAAPDERDGTGRQRDVEQWPAWAADAESASQARVALLSLEWGLLVAGVLFVAQDSGWLFALGAILLAGYVALQADQRRRR